MSTRHRRIGAWALAAVLLASTPCFAQSKKPPAPSSPETPAQRKRPAELVSLVEDAFQCPPEWRADALIKLAAPARDVDPKWAKELLEDAFAVAPKAQQSTPLDYQHSFPTDSDEGVTMRMQSWQVDALSLECRAASAMIEVDRARAVELFDAIEPDIPSEPSPCDHLLLPRVPIYFDTLFQIAKSCYGPAERKRGEDIPFVERRLSRLKSSVDAGSALVALAKATADPIRLARYVAALETGFAGSAPDSAAFRLSLSRDWLFQNYDALRKECAAARVPDTALVAAFRAYVVKNLSAPRCDFKGQEPDTDLEEIVAAFNAGVPEPQRIRPEESRPERIDTVDDKQPFWYTSSVSLDVLIAEAKLNDAGGSVSVTGEPAPPGGEPSPEWKAKWREAAAKLRAWQSTDERSEASYFQMKSVAFISLVERTPEGPLRDGLLEEYLAFVRLSPLEREKPTDWFGSLDYLLHVVGTGRFEGRQRILEALLGSKEPVIRLYARFALKESKK